MKNSSLVFLLLASGIGCDPSAVGGRKAMLAADPPQNQVRYLSPPGRISWQKAYGPGRIGAIAASPVGGFAVTGYFEGSIDLGCGAMSAHGLSDLFVAQFDGSGKCVWSRRAGGSADHNGAAIAIDVDGSIFVAGSYDGDSDLGIPPSEVLIGFIARYDREGTLLWATSLGGAGEVYPFDLALADKDVLVAGSDGDAFLTRFEGSSGVPQWSRSFGGAGWDAINGVGVLPSGSIAVAGNFQDKMQMGDVELVADGGSDAFLALLAADGQPVLARHDGGSGDDSLSDLAIDATGAIRVTGYFQSPAMFGGVEVGGSGVYTAITASFDIKLQQQWAMVPDASSSGWGGAIAIDGSGDVVIAGNSTGDTGASEAMIFKYTSDGSVYWGRTFGGAGAVDGTAVVALVSGDLVLGGEFEKTLDSSLGELQGGQAVFLMGVSP